MFPAVTPTHRLPGALLFISALALADAGGEVHTAEAAEAGEAGAALVPDAYDLAFHIGAVFIVAAVSLVGAFLPILLARLPARFTGARAFVMYGSRFGAGTILAIGFFHMLVPAIAALTSPCLPEVWTTGFPVFAPLFCVVAILLMQLGHFLALDFAAKRHARVAGCKSVKDEEEVMVEVRAVTTTTTTAPAPPAVTADTASHSSAGGAHAHAHHPLVHSCDDTRKVGATLLEVGVAIHSVIIGVALGVVGDDEFTTILIAISFHQFFEGFALGAAIVEAKFSRLVAVLFACIYAITTPVGIAIGIGVRMSYNSNATAALIVTGVFEALAAGVLVYTALVELITVDMTFNEAVRRASTASKAGQFLALYLGVAVFAVIAIWA